MNTSKKVLAVNFCSTSLNLVHISLILLIFLTGFFLRVIWLGKVPVGFTNDEANIGYDAYSILKTGKDQWGDTQPRVSLKGFGDYRPPLYTYLVIPSIASFGLNETAVRLPAAIAGSLTLLTVFILALLFFQNVWVAILAMLLLCVDPWHVGMSRVAIESTVGVFLVTVGLISFVLGLKKSIWMYFAVLFFVLSIYTYTSYIVFIPLFFISCLLYVRREMKNKSLIIGAVVLFFLFLMPLFIGNGSNTASVRSGQVNLMNNIGVINVVNDKRGSCEKDYQGKLCQIFQNKYATFFSIFITNYLSHFSPELLAEHGTTTQYSVLPERGLLYLSEFVLMFFGIIFLLQQKKRYASVLFLWLLLAPIPDSVTGNGHYSRYLIVLPLFQILGGLGVYQLYLLLKKKAILLIPAFIFFSYEVISFFSVYWTYFPIFYSNFSHYGYRELVSYIQLHENEYKKIIVSNNVNDTKQYIYYLFYTKYDPARYQSGIGVEKENETNGWIRVTKIGSIYFLSSLPLNEKTEKGFAPQILFAGGSREFTGANNPIYTVTDLQNHVLFHFVEQ